MRRTFFWLTIGMLGAIFPAAADTLKFSNCGDKTPNVVTYNAMDGFCWVPRSQATLTRCGTVTFTCDGECQVKIEGRLTGFECGGGHPDWHLSGEMTYNDWEHIVETAKVRNWNSTDWSKYCTCDKAEMQW
jgi:hypothetical protein